MATTIPGPVVTEADLGRLAEHDAFRDPESVLTFVREHPEVVGPLLEAVEVMPR